MAQLIKIRERFATIDQSRVYSLEHFDLLAYVPMSDIMYRGITSIIKDVVRLYFTAREQQMASDAMKRIVTRCHIKAIDILTLKSFMPNDFMYYVSMNANVDPDALDMFVTTRYGIHPDLYMKFVDGPESMRPKCMSVLYPLFQQTTSYASKYSRESFVRFCNYESTQISLGVVLNPRDIIGITANDITNSKWFVLWVSTDKPICVPGLTVALASHILTFNGPIMYDDTIEKIVAHQGWSYYHLANPFIDKREYLKMAHEQHMTECMIEAFIHDKNIYIDIDTANAMCEYVDDPQTRNEIHRHILPAYPAPMNNGPLSPYWQNDAQCLAENYRHHRRVIETCVYDHWTKKMCQPGAIEYHRGMYQ